MLAIFDKNGHQMMARTANSPVNKDFLEFLKEELIETRRMNDTLEGVKLNRSQGKAIFIQELFDEFENARQRTEALEKAERTSSEPAPFY